MIHLPNVTLLAVDTANLRLTLRAMQRCAKDIQFGDMVLLTDTANAQKYGGFHRPYRTGVIPKFATATEGGSYLFKSLHLHIKTDFLLSVQYDGFVLNPDQWSDEFLEYDYIGARWHWHPEGQDVGNSGFSLSSKRLWQVLADNYPPPSTETAGDVYICCTLRPELETRFGIKFAPGHIADRFSCERAVPDVPPLGFHGLFNMATILNDDEVLFLAKNLATYAVLRYDYLELMTFLHKEGRTKPVQALYDRLKTEVPDLVRHFVAVGMLSVGLAQETVARFGA